MITLGLFLIGSLHTMIFAIFQIPENFLMGHGSWELSLICKVIFYVFGVGFSFGHQILCRKFGLRKTLYFGLLCNFFGLLTLLINLPLEKGFVPLIILNMVFFGMALTSVINSLITYIIIEYPKRIGMAIVALFAFFNLGVMCAPLLMDLFHEAGKPFAYVFLLIFLMMSIWFVHVYFINPPIPSKEIQLPQESIIWKVLHYRLGLFVVAIIAYALTETTFSLWGFIEVQNHFGADIANNTIPLFWMFLIIGQVFLLIPLYFLPAKRIFYFLIVVLIGSSWMFPYQQTLGEFALWLALAGFGCSAVFPILLSQMEKEIIPVAQGKEIPFIEKSTSIMIAGYVMGVGVIDLWIQLLGSNPVFLPASHFHMAAGFIAITGLISIFIDLTAPKV